MASLSPVVRRRRLAAELRRLREAAGRTIEDVAEQMECSTAKVSRIETGRVTARILDVREMLDIYGVTGPDRDRLLDLVREARQKGWWHAYSDLMTDEVATFVGFEDEATTICAYQADLVLGLFQTEDYTRALFHTWNSGAGDTGEAERRVALRQRRQQIITRDPPTEVLTVIDQSVLHRIVGGPAVMSAQVSRLVELAQMPNITMHVLPFDRPCPGVAVPFTVLGFANPADAKVAYAEVVASQVVSESPEKVARYVWAFDQVRANSLSPEESLAFLRDRAT